MIQKMLEFWSQHVFLSNLSHAAGGFGFAVILQRYLRGNPFIPVAVGWVLLAFCLGAHAYAYAS